jgi:hypothetical protein
MAWVLKVYDHTNTTLQGTLTSAHGVGFLHRLGTVGMLTFTVDMESSADLALLGWRSVVRVYPDGESSTPLGSFFVDDKPAELETASELPSVEFRCPALDAWLGTADLGGAVVYPYGGTAGAQQDPRRFGPEALEFDDSGWASPPSTDGTRSLGGEDVPWFTSTNRSLYRLVIPQGSGSFPGRMLLRASRRLEVRVYLDADRVLSKQTGQTGVTQFDVDYDDTADRVVLIDVAGSGKVAWAWGVVTDDEDEDLGDIEFSTGTAGWRQLDNYTAYPGMSPGYIIKTLVEEAQDESTDRGALDGLTIDFDEAEDSDGVAWTGTIAHAFSVGSKLGWVLEQVTQFGYDWRVTPTGVLQLFEFMGQDRTGTVDLDVLESSRADGTGIKATAMLWLSAGSMSETAVESAVGRIEEAATFGTSDSAIKLEAVVADLLDDLSIPRDAQTLVLSQQSPQPLDDFFLGDVVSYTGRDGSTTGRVTAIDGTQEDDGLVTWTVTVDFEDGAYNRERARRIRDQLRETFAQTVGGRALLAAPRAEGLPPAQVTSVEGRGGADPRTLTLEAVDVEVPAGEPLRIPWQTVPSPALQVRFDPPDLPEPSIPLPASAVWKPRVEAQWSDEDLEPDVTLTDITYPFKGGGTVDLMVNGLHRWPVEMGGSAPVAKAGIHRRFESDLPSMDGEIGDEVSVQVAHDSDVARTLKSARLTLTLIEPNPDAGASTPVDTINGNPEAVCTNGPSLWVRFQGGDGDAVNMLDGYRDAEDNLCAPGAAHSGAPFIVDSDGPYGAASYTTDSFDGLHNYQRNGGGRIASFIARIRVESMPDTGNSGWLIAPTGSSGAASGEASAMGLRRASNLPPPAGGGPGSRRVFVRFRLTNYPVDVGSGWRMIGATIEGDITVAPRLVTVLDGQVIHDVPLEPFGSVSEVADWRFFEGIDTFGTSFQAVRFAGVAEAVAWPDARKLDRIQLLDAMRSLAREGSL